MNKEEKIHLLLTRGVERVVEHESLYHSLNSKKKLRVKLGIDPTSPDLHLGHAVVLRKLREFQDLGHKIILIIGDFTARIGDPSGQSQTRAPLTAKEIRRNKRDYLKQANLIIDVKKAEVLHNSKWLRTLKYEKAMELLSLVNLNQVLEREDFSERMSAHKPIKMYELLYPVMQAYDSVMVKADVEIGGVDQTLNLFMGRQLMERLGMVAQDILTTPLLTGLDGGRKMSKSLNNYVALRDDPREMFGKIMSLKDSLVDRYFELCTDVSQEEIRKIHNAAMSLIVLKERLAYEIVKLCHGEKKAVRAREFFEKTFRKKELPRDIPVFKFPAGENLGNILRKAGLVPSLSEYRRLLRQGAVEVDRRVLWEVNFKPRQPAMIRIGKKRFLKIVPNY